MPEARYYYASLCETRKSSQAIICHSELTNFLENLFSYKIVTLNSFQGLVVSESITSQAEGVVCHRDEDARSKKLAFTLAEVLITLGVIGVVAALTLPTLISTYKKQVVETKLAKFYSIVNQALKRAEADYGPMTSWDPLSNGFENDENNQVDYNSPKALPWFNKYLKPYLKCADVKYSKGIEGRIVCYFQDGSAASFAGSTWLYYPEAKNFKEFYSDESGMVVEIREGGTNVFTFRFIPTRSGMYTFGYNLSDTMLYNNSKDGCNPDATETEHAMCSTLIMRNGWKIPDDYPFKF